MPNPSSSVQLRRIAIASPYSEEPSVITGGVEGATYALVMGLRKLCDAEVHILSPSSTNLEYVREVRDEAIIHWIPRQTLPGFISYWTTYRRKLLQLIRSIDPTIVHFQGMAGWSLGCEYPHVLTIHGINELDAKYSNRRFTTLRSHLIRQVENFGRRHQHDTIIINPYVESQIGDAIRGRRWRIENPVLQDWFDLKRRPVDQTILFAGRIGPRKNVHGLLEAFRQIRRKAPNSVLKLAGRADSHTYLAFCQKMIDESDLKNNVKFLGNLGRLDLQIEVSRAAIMALPSFQETAPLIIGECMAAGLPVIGSRVGGIPDMIDDGATGYIVDAHKPAELSDRALTLLLNSDLAMAMGRTAQAIAQNRFHYLKVAERTLEVYSVALTS